MYTTWFWVVLGEDDKRLVRHETHDGMERAEAEAKRLAGENPGKTFHVLKATHAACTQQPVAFLETDDGIPF